MKITVLGHHLPGRDPGQHRDVRVGIQVRRDAVELVPGDAEEATWVAEVTESYGSESRDFHGPAVQGRKGERFLYLVWVEGPDAEMFRRLKIMLADAPEAEEVVARVHLTDDLGLPRCARVAPPAIEWSA